MNARLRSRRRLAAVMAATTLAVTAGILAVPSAANAASACQPAGYQRVICATGWEGFPPGVQFAGIHHNWNYPLAFYITYVGGRQSRVCVPVGETYWEDSSAVRAGMNILTNQWGIGFPEPC